MSKLAALVAIPLGLLALKRLQKEFPDDPTPKKLIPDGFTLGPAGGSGMDITPFFPDGLQLTTTIPGGAVVGTGPATKLGMDTDVVPFFPETAVTAGKEFAEKKPFEFKPELLPRGPLPTDFTIDWTSRPTD